MIVEHRTYTFRPGAVDGWLKKYEAEGLPIQKRHLGRFVGLYVSEIGRLHRIVLIWAYESLADRERRRAAVTADPAWQAFIPSLRGLVALHEQAPNAMQPGAHPPTTATQCSTSNSTPSPTGARSARPEFVVKPHWRPIQLPMGGEQG
ncbi:MAG: NIPSNAP family protein, partial [Rhodospirillaceae bacterium]|nr:NIPSNAP family protein [Rhodospirillaceae bacterium]